MHLSSLPIQHDNLAIDLAFDELFFIVCTWFNKAASGRR